MAKQTEIPGAFEEVNPKIEAACEAFVKAKASHAKAKTFLDRRYDELVEAMREAGVKVYRSEELEKDIVLETDTRLKLIDVKEEKPTKAKGKKGAKDSTNGAAAE